VLRETWQTKLRDDLFFAGQISGVEGYVESAASGLIAGRNAAALSLPTPPPPPPPTTATGIRFQLSRFLAWRKKYSAATTPNDATPAATKNANL
jgi:folate-dependent tRNA-U54 methylase TrmFO/GidA